MHGSSITKFPDWVQVKVTGDIFIIHKLEYYYFRLLFESEIALFLNDVWGRSAFDEKLAKNPHYPTRLTLDGAVMVPRDNCTLVFSTELLNHIILLPLKGKAGTITFGG